MTSEIQVLLRTVAFIVLLGVVCSVESENYQMMFKAFKEQYGRDYASVDEEKQRFEIFKTNMNIAKELQQKNPLASFGVNEFADISNEEFKIRHNGEEYYRRAVKNKQTMVKYSEDEVLSAKGRSIDWREKGAVTGVKNQGKCGSCWAFSTTGGIEGQWFLAGNELTSVSEQELTSCDTNDSGCKGGLMDDAFRWLLDNRQGQIVTEKSYPYVSGNGNVPSCSANLQNKPVGAVISGYHDLPSNEDQMAAFVYKQGPLSIGVDATSWQFYTGGILTNCISNHVDHGVLIVGFNDNNNPPYWIIKNSWGSSWGEDGYIRVEKGTNQCLITTFPTSSIVKK